MQIYADRKAKKSAPISVTKSAKISDPLPRFLQITLLKFTTVVVQLSGFLTFWLSGLPSSYFLSYAQVMFFVITTAFTFSIVTSALME